MYQLDCRVVDTDARATRLSCQRPTKSSSTRLNNVPNTYRVPSLPCEPHAERATTILFDNEP